MSEWKLKRGATPVEGGVLFSAWAPTCEDLSVEVVGRGTHRMEKRGEVFEVVVADASPGSDYFFHFKDGRRRPDPVSKWQPNGVHNASRVLNDQGFQWTDHKWRGLPLESLILYELHVGTFTPEGTFDGVIAQLPHLTSLGVNAISLMPIAQFPGTRNWGYDAVHLYAVQNSYGGPKGLKQLINACHEQGLAVFVDVVYNHVGLEGNYLAEFGPYFTDQYKTPWGPAINFDGAYSDGVRQYFLENALYWLTEYHADGLRIDAVHAIFDFSAYHILEELKDRFSQEAKELGRLAWLIAESDLNDSRIIHTKDRGGYGLHAQWNDDFHHAIRTSLSKDRSGYFVDFDGLNDVKRALTDGYVVAGRYSPYRKRRHGNSSTSCLGAQFVTFIQNHDQIANASKGLRLAQGISHEAQKMAALISICAANLPMLFMGEEWAASSPFFYFTSFGDAELGERVREGRMKELGLPIDPQAEQTFKDSCLNWSELGTNPHAEILRFYRDLLALRRRLPALHDCRKDQLDVQLNEREEWLILHRQDVLIIANFAPTIKHIPISPFAGTWTLALASDEPKYGGKLEPQERVSLGSSKKNASLSQFSAAIFTRSLPKKTEL